MSETSPATYQCKYLTGTKLQVFLAIAGRIVPPYGDNPGGATLATAGVVDWSMNKMPPDLRGKLLLFLTVSNTLGYFFGGSSFVKNSPDAQDRQLRWMESGPIKLFRMGFFGVKTYACMGHYTREEVWPSFNYDGPILPERPYPDTVIRGISQGKIKVLA